MNEFLSSLPGPIAPLAQRGRDYMRQRQMGVNDILLDNRIIFLGTFGNAAYSDNSGSFPIVDVVANATIQQLLYLQYENRTQEIHFYINSPGGSVTSTLAIYDTMQFLDCPICTYCVGMAASGAAVLLAAGTKGKRFALPHSRIMLHQPWGRIGGQASDVEIEMNEMLRIKEELNTILARHTGKNVEEIAVETERNRYFSADHAKTYGLIDDVVIKPKPT